MSSIDVLVIGRGTFDKVRTFEEWPYTGKRVIVLSRTLREGDLPAALAEHVELHAGPVEQLVSDLETSGARHLYVDGGKVIQSFLAAGLIDTLILTRIPVLIGSGIPLFGPTGRDISLEHVRTRDYPNGFVQSTYRVGR